MKPKPWYRYIDDTTRYCAWINFNQHCSRNRLSIEFFTLMFSHDTFMQYSGKSWNANFKWPIVIAPFFAPWRASPRFAKLRPQNPFNGWQIWKDDIIICFSGYLCACHVQDNGWFNGVPIFIKKWWFPTLVLQLFPPCWLPFFFANKTGELFCLGLLAPPFGAIFASADRWVKRVAWLELVVVLALQGRARFATTAFTVRQGGHPWKMLAFIVLTCMKKWSFIKIAFLEAY